MKKLITIIAILFYINSSAQGTPAIAIYQDVAMAVKDDKHGNEAFTTNLLLRLELQGYQMHNHYFSVIVNFEYADLTYSEYVRYAFGLGWTFNEWIDNVEFSTSVNVGMIGRNEVLYMGSLGATGEIAYKLNDKIKIGLLGQVTERTDVKAIWGSSDYIRFSGFLGLKYQF